MSVYSAPPRDGAMRKKRKSFDLHRLLIEAKLIALEVGTAIVFLAWVYHEVMHELGR